MKKVDFFIVGAPKCGTTSLHEYLRKHPEIFIPNLKDRPYFGDDIYPDMNEKEHFEIYDEKAKGKLVGESCVWYLYSKTAAKQIYNYNPKAKIIIMLRNPADVLCSLHTQLVYNSVERIRDFNAALKSEKRRKLSYKKNKSDYYGRSFLYYSEVVDFASQIRGYFAVFKRNNIKVIIFDDFVNNTAEVYRDTLAFLNVKDVNFKPNFIIHNKSHKALIPSIQRLIYHPPRVLKIIFYTIFNYRIRYRIITSILDKNQKYQNRNQTFGENRKKLIVIYENKIRNLENLLKIDLSYWYQKI